MKKIYAIILALLACLATGALTACSPEDKPAVHKHKYEKTWSYDETYHWYACEGEDCTEVSKKAEHGFVNNVCSECSFTVSNQNSEQGNNGENSTNAIIYTVTDEKKQEILSSFSSIRGFTLVGEATSTSNNSTALLFFNLFINENLMKLEQTRMGNFQQAYFAYNINGKAYEYTEGEDGFKKEEIDNDYNGEDLTEFATRVIGFNINFKDKLLEAEYDEAKKCYIATGEYYGDVITFEYYYENNAIVKARLGYDDLQNGQVIETIWITYDFKNVPEIVLPTVHEHTFTSTWEINDTYHWNTSTCTDHETRKLNQASHSFDKNNVCLVCGYVAEESDGLAYQLSLDETYYIVTGIGNFTGDTLVIPEEYNSLPVKEIGAYALQEAEFITVIIPDTVEIIKTYAFEDCNSLRKVIIGAGIKEIQHRAFYSWLNITEIYIYAETPPQLDGQTWQFNGACTLYVPADYYDVYVSLEGSRGWGEFSKKTIVPEDQNIIDGVCYNKDNTGIVFVDKSVEGDFVIPNTVTKIYPSAFEDCRYITSVTIPSSVTYIGSNAFSGLKETVKVYYNGTVNQWAQINFEAGNANPFSKTQLVYINDSQVESINLSNMEKISNYAFYNCKSLTELNIVNAVKEIGEGAFYGCENLSAIDFGEDLISIGYGAFYGCDNIREVAFPTSLQKIDSYAFSDCEMLQSVYITKNVNEIGEDAFRTENLSSISVDSLNATYSSIDGLLYNKEVSQLIFVPMAKSGNVLIPNTVTQIDATAFINCPNISSITVQSGNPKYHSAGNCIIDTANKALVATCKNSVIPNDGSVNKITGSVFSKSWNLGDVTIPSSITLIGNRAFSQSDFENLIFEDNCNIEIGIDAFFSTSGESVVFGENSRYILAGDSFSSAAYNTIIFGEGSEYMFYSDVFWNSDFYAIIIDSENLISQLTSEYSCGELLTCLTNYSYGNADVESGIYVKSTIDVSNCYLETSGGYTKTLVTLDGVEYYLYK